MAQETVEERITHALLALMAEKNLADISITELCVRAGTSRISFYRNFASFEDVLVRHLTSIAVRDWDANVTEGMPEEQLWGVVFSWFETLRPTLELIHRSGVDHVFYDFCESCARPFESEGPEGYYRAAIAGTVYGIYRQWVRDGMQESAAELAAITYGMRSR